MLTRQGSLHLAAVLDAHIRAMLGWSMGDRADQALASTALEMVTSMRRKDMPYDNAVMERFFAYPSWNSRTMIASTTVIRLKR